MYGSFCFQLGGVVVLSLVTMKGHWTQQRRHWNCWTLKIVVACCIVLFFFSPAFSRKLPAAGTDSRTSLRRSALLERRLVEQRVERSEVHGRILDEVEGEPGDMTNDYSTPTHNRDGNEETPHNPPASEGSVRGTMRYRQDRIPQQFARYTAQYGHRHLRGV